MKNRLIMLTILATATLFSCAKKEEKPAEVIVIEQPAEQAAPVEQPAPVENTDGTTIEVDENGLKVNSEKTSVDIKDGKAKVEVKN
ncbi:MAG TPA: hypothetical protein P5335_05390 [Flavobacterium sp.]|nr:hypothetical protein [Flavobacterium sp.]